MSDGSTLTKATYRAVLVVALLGACGCRGYEFGLHNWFDPSRPIRTPDQATVNPIFTQLGPTDQTTELVPNATFPTPEDLQYNETDYVIGPSDILRISILDLLQEGLETVLERQVSFSGYISLPLLGDRIKAAGLTKHELTEKIKKLLQPDILRDPTVNVSVTVPRQSIFSVVGAVARPGTYNIVRRDFTLLEALALAGDVTQSNLKWVYVIRPRRRKPKPAEKPAERPEELPPLPTLPTPSTAPATAPATGPGKGIEQRLKELEKFIPGAVGAAGQVRYEQPAVLLSAVGSAPEASGGSAAPGAGGAATTSRASGELGRAAVTYKWVYSGGQWIRVAQQTSPATRQAARVQAPSGPTSREDPFGWMQYDMSGLARIIAVDLDRLKAGDPKMNIIIRDNDIVHVPPLEVGEFYVMGEVLRPGSYVLTGRRVTVKQAIAAAGNLGPLSWPNNSILIRRVGRDEEEIRPLHLQDIMAGREPDFFLKPNDVIAVGSYWAAPFLAVWRNAFRMTYGFGFIYDRNYSDREFEIPIFFPRKGFRVPG